MICKRVSVGDYRICFCDYVLSPTLQRIEGGREGDRKTTPSIYTFIPALVRWRLGDGNFQLGLPSETLSPKTK